MNYCVHKSRKSYGSSQQNYVSNSHLKRYLRLSDKKNWVE